MLAVLQRGPGLHGVFTANATGALKLVGESYPFAPGGRLLLTVDNHNSVNGIREFARPPGRARSSTRRSTVPELRLDRAALESQLATADQRRAEPVRLPRAVEFLRREAPAGAGRASAGEGWDVLLDAAAFVPTNPSRPAACRPDFVCVSFYKMFGYPTGVGCLLVRNAALATLSDLVRRRHRQLRDGAGTRSTSSRRARPDSRTAR